MVTIIGNGMGEYDFSNIDIDLECFDTILCDKNFTVEGEKILRVSYSVAKEYILENYNKEDILYVVTGSPLFFSAGMLVAKQLPYEKVKVINNTSSKEYMQERLLISESEMQTLSLHGRSLIDLTKFLTSRYTFILCGTSTIEKLQEALVYLKPEDISVTIGYKLGYKDEVIEQINIFDKSYRAYDMTQPYVLVIEKLFDVKALSKDSDFQTERGMITKEYKRNLSLQNLDLEANQLLWDVGAGSGSCGIEAFKRYRVRTIFFEKQQQRCDFIEENLRNHRVVASKLYVGEAQDLFESIEENPERIFVGGGGEKVIAKLPYLYERLKENGVMLINAITLKHLSQMITVLNENSIEYEIFSLSLTTYKGKLDLVEPERQLFQLKIRKEEKA